MKTLQISEENKNYTVSLNVTYFVIAPNEEEAVTIASCAALGIDAKTAINGEIDIDKAIVTNGHNYTIEH
jgi:hypothetical protein